MSRSSRKGGSGVLNARVRIFGLMLTPDLLLVKTADLTRRNAVPNRVTHQKPRSHNRRLYQMTEYYDAGDGIDWANEEDVKIPSVLPRPFKWAVLVMPVQPKTKSKGGIELPQEVRDNQGHLQVVGKVAAIGPVAFKSFKLCSGLLDYLRVLCGFQIVGAPKVGDWVIYGRYTGMRFEFNGTRIVMMNDDELLADPVEPQNIRVYV